MSEFRSAFAPAFAEASSGKKATADLHAIKFYE